MIGVFRTRTLGRYIAGKFLMGILATMLLCSILIYLIDFVELLRQSGKGGDVPLYMLVGIALLRLPAYVEILIPFAVLVGAIMALLNLSRSSELTVMRAGGMSVWQFLRPGILVAFIVGALTVTVFNPLAAAGRDLSEDLFAEVFGRETNLLRSRSGSSWLRQNGADGQSVMSAAIAKNRGLSLLGVSVFVFDGDGRFVERVDGKSADLHEGYWEVKEAWVVRLGREPEKFDIYLVSTYLTPERVSDALGTLLSVSFWELPALIEVAEKAKLSASRLEVQYEALLSRPFLCAAMVLLAATVSLRSFRGGGIQTMVITGLVGGFGFFLLMEVSRQIGVAGLAPPWAAIWLPVVLVIIVSASVLLHQEDG
ncbi:LPS export ABC transporter permease LptG [Hyphomicrobium sp. D-2]|uniref:LPS export ABC transporter permease LptG n=1 Tax=Hyphomicrobium sp. D-2 TaxID=3041621 RepID=UPI002453A48D|nr:LPS export ABC transporter permease LptG [Hyphomicrobium sp. D-2]MDH4981624.1 LPS export ABC transporter permease LptG [Hyphomicrobium sp. D-2]